MIKYLYLIYVYFNPVIIPNTSRFSLFQLHYFHSRYLITLSNPVISIPDTSLTLCHSCLLIPHEFNQVIFHSRYLIPLFSFPHEFNPVNSIPDSSSM